MVFIGFGIALLHKFLTSASRLWSETPSERLYATDPNGTRTLGYYNQNDLPYYYDLATFFATSDAWHSPILANTVPNRMYLMAATSFGHQYPDADSNHPRYSAPTIFRAMNTANVSWIYYYKDGIFVQNFADYADPSIGPRLAATGQQLDPGGTAEFAAAVETQRRSIAATAKALGIQD